jgi:polyisoprenoid-binding protein YceI
MKRVLVLTALAAVGACGRVPDKDQAGPATEAAAPGVISPAVTEAPAGEYTIDKSHSSLLFRVDHIGFSRYTARFRAFDATLQLDPKAPEKASVTATIDPSSLEIDSPPLGFLDLLLGPDWLDARTFPEMTFKSTQVGMTGSSSARVMGDLTMHGVTKPVVLDVTFNGGYAGHQYEPNARIGFSARGALSRVAFGVDEGLPPPGSKMGVGDEVEVVIEAEFTGPPWANAGESPG